MIHGLNIEITKSRHMQAQSAVTDNNFGQSNAFLPKRMHSLDKFHGFTVESKPVVFTDKDFIGSGFFGSVFKAKTIDGREVAVKRVSKDKLRFNCCFAEKEKQNLEFISGVNFQNFIGYFGGYVLGDYAHFVLELGDVQLEKLLNWKLDEMNVYSFNNIAYQTLGMIAYLDEIGVRHGDMHFSNMVYFYSTDQIKLVDFELSSFPGDQYYDSPLFDLGKLGGCLFKLQLRIKGYDNNRVSYIDGKILGSSNIDHVLAQNSWWLDDLNQDSKCSIAVAVNIRETFLVSTELGKTKGKEVVGGRDCFFPRNCLPGLEHYMQTAVGPFAKPGRSTGDVFVV